MQTLLHHFFDVIVALLIEHTAKKPFFQIGQLKRIINLHIPDNGGWMALIHIPYPSNLPGLLIIPAL